MKTMIRAKGSQGLAFLFSVVPKLLAKSGPTGAPDVNQTSGKEGDVREPEMETPGPST